MAQILREVVVEVKPGAKAKELNRLAESLILKSGGKPAFKGYPSKGGLPFPATLCVSINEEVVHGFPANKTLQEGDLVKLDLGMKWPADRGFFTDTAVTVGIGGISGEAEKLVKATEKALAEGIKKVKSGSRVGDISSAIQICLEQNKIGIVRDLAGHGVGHAVHEEPLIPNFGKKGVGPELVEGTVLAIEVMTTLGNGKIKLAGDGWTYTSADGTLGAHFEHTVAVTEKGSEILTL